MSIDVEDWFQVENLRSAITKESWPQREFRAERNTDLILEILRQNNTKATFFILAWCAEKAPQIVRRIHAEGHEIASHGYGHDLVYNLTHEQFREDIRKSKSLIEDITGERVLGYRAPNFSITDWAIEILMELGFRYDSSLFPTMAHDRYGKLTTFKIQDAPVFELRDGFYQVLLSCLPLLGKNFPWAGGGYFRLIPYPVFQRGVARILAGRGTYCFYIHPWEFDPGQPRVKNVKASNRFRHYNNLARTEARYRQLVADFRFEPIRNALPPL
ncbi:MAG: DUF3473 domain-containing protein [Verrucomicrobia bacterium]|nr:DUF3473 domain-containing protein [Verrucomicrobiota bacterium]